MRFYVCHGFIEGAIQNEVKTVPYLDLISLGKNYLQSMSSISV